MTTTEATCRRPVARLRRRVALEAWRLGGLWVWVRLRAVRWVRGRSGVPAQCGRRELVFDGGCQVGDEAPQLVVHDLRGQPARLADLWRDTPALLVTGSKTCGWTRSHARLLSAMARQFEGRLRVAMLYVVEPHPCDAPSPYRDGPWVTLNNRVAGIRATASRSITDRRERAEWLRRKYRMRGVTMLIDTMEDTAWRALGGGPNVAVLVARGGRVQARQGWFDPPRMRAAVAALLAADGGGSAPAAMEHRP